MESAELERRVVDLVAHRTPDEMARDLIRLQDAQAQQASEPLADDEPVAPEAPEQPDVNALNELDQADEDADDELDAEVDRDDDR